jgi:hypothetical protein
VDDGLFLGLPAGRGGRPQSVPQGIEIGRKGETLKVIVKIVLEN